MLTFIAIRVHKLEMCVAQFRCSSITIPRNLELAVCIADVLIILE